MPKTLEELEEWARLLRKENHPLAETMEEIAEGWRTDKAPLTALLEAAEIIEARIAYYASLYEESVPNIEEWGYTDNSGDMAKLRQAISKAKGEQ